jgi:hypothetical protein
VILHWGTFSDKEITLLVGVPDKDLGLLKLADGLPIAQKNLADLTRDFQRRRYERIIGTSSRRISG